MKNYRKIIYPLTALLLAFVLAACQGTRNLESIEITDAAGEALAQPLVMSVGDTQELALRAHYDNGTIDGVGHALISWESSDDSVATVSAGGVLTAESASLVDGVTITATHSPATDDVFEDEITVIVEDIL